MHAAAAPRLSGWGRLSRPAREIVSEDVDSLTEGAVLSRGLGRSYGDSAVPPPSHPVVATTRLADRLLAFDPVTGVLRAESGTSIEALNRVLLPRGFFVPVTPGTQFVTLGGAVAADVHGKNHHRDGCFGEHVLSLRMRIADGRVLTCGPTENEELFWATVGGMGLTGHILDVELRMRRVPSSWIRQETRRVRDIDEYVEELRLAAARSPYTVGWIDCLSRGRDLGRGVLISGDFCETEEAPRTRPRPRRKVTFPAELPSFAVGRTSVRAFNAVLYLSHFGPPRRDLVSWESFFYPLDSVGEWNKMYGKRGFTQYQCVVPEGAGPSAARRVLDVLTRRGGASFLCVIKDCGPEGRGMLSFPTKGISIALDLPVRDDTQSVVDALNERVLEEGGRIYLAKDSFTRAEHFRAMEPRLERFLEVRRKWDPEGRIRSAQSVRLFGDAP
jgi:decaprenylphospho-beta-D-ribofuranose 2-oxidase